MYNLIRRFFAFIFPIFGTALTNIVLDESEKYIRNKKIERIVERRHRLYEEYGRYATQGDANLRQGAVHNRPPEFFDDLKKPTGDTRFHDVIMVAFDLQGRSAEDVHGWLMSKMPRGDDEITSAEFGTIFLDAWWVANDERFDGSDCDSAVFVTMGNQTRARQELKMLGLVHG